MTLGLGDAIFWIAVACCVVAQAAIVRAAVLAPRADAPAAAVPRPRRVAEVVWAVLPALALAFALVATWRRMHPGAPLDREAPPAPAAIGAAPGGGPR